MAHKPSCASIRLEMYRSSAIAWAVSELPNIGAPEFGDLLHVLGFRPVELPAIQDPHGSHRDFMSQWILRLPFLKIAGGSDHGEKPN